MREYVDKKDLEGRGFVCTGGLVKRLSLIERYYVKGWLKFGDKRLDAKIRLDAANRLASDFYFSRFPSNKAIDLQKERVDGGLNKTEPEKVLEARDRFFKAIKEIPFEFWEVVQDVVLYENKPNIDCSNKRVKEYELFRIKNDLCRGLDRLAWHYGVLMIKRKILAEIPKEQAIIKKRRYEIEV